MASHIMKATIEIADDLFQRAQRLARKEETTLRALTEQGLRLVLKEREAMTAQWKWKPLVVQGEGMTGEFKNARWERVRDEIYRGRGA
jgi:predicted transcriptional regulator